MSASPKESSVSPMILREAEKFLFGHEETF